MRIFFLGSVIAIFILLLSTGPAFALQAHGAPEGLYAHQLAHLFFILCMGSFAYRIHRYWLPGYSGWKYFVLGAILLMTWNLWAFSGHFITLLVPEKSFFLPEGKLIPLLHIVSWKEVLYYFLKLDHLLCVPALLCFYLGLKRIQITLTHGSKPDRCP